MPPLAVAALALVVATHAPAWAVRLDQPAPEFTLPDDAGTPTALADLRGRVVVLDFWATWCAVCVDTLPKLDAMARRYGEDALIVLAVNIDADRDKVSRFLDAHVPGAAFRVLYDSRGRVMARYGAEGMPALFVIDRFGTVRHVVTGETGATLIELRAVVAPLLPPGPSPASRDLAVPGALP